MDETDLFFNLRLGELVMGSGHVATQNLLSFTHPAATDINLAWLFQLLLALVHRAAGIPGTVLLKTAFVLTTWGVLFRVAVRRGAHSGLAAACLALAAWAAEPRFVERPHLVTFLGLALLLLALERAEAKQPRLLWWLVPCGLLWANANSCFFLAPALLLLYGLGASLDGAPSAGGRALLVALAFIPLLVATPSGFHCFTYIANHFRMPNLRPLEEYRHARWPLDGPYFFLLAGLLVATVLSRPGRQAASVMPMRVFLPCAALGLLGGLRIRFVAEFAILAGPALAVAATRLAARTGPFFYRWQGWFRVATGSLLVALTIGPRAMAKAEGGRLVDLGIETDLVPMAAIDFVERNGLRQRMYNDLEVGSYLTWRGWPRYRVFQDPRINGYPEAFHAVLRRSDLSRQQWQQFLDGFAVTSALVTYPAVNPRGALFDPRLWGLVYRANDGLVFVRRPVPKNLTEIPLSFSYSTATGLLSVPLDPMPAEATVSVCEWQRRLGDYHRSVGDNPAALRAFSLALASETGSACARAARTDAGLLALQLGQPGRAEELLAGDAGMLAKTNHGYALLGLGRAAAALSDFDSVLAVAADNDEATFGRGLALVALGQPGRAAMAFQTLLARSPGHISAPAARLQLQHLGASAGER